MSNTADASDLRATRLINIQRLTIALLLWALLCAGLLCWRENQRVRAARLAEANAVQDRLAQNATVDQYRGIVRRLQQEIEQYESRHGKLPADGAGVTSGGPPQSTEPRNRLRGVR